MKVLLDNGHGVNTPGKQSPDGRVREYSYCREIVRRVAASLAARGIDAEIIVSEEADVSLGQRVARINAECDRLGAKNVLLVSVHLNASGNGSAWGTARGFSVFCSKNASELSHRCAELFTEGARRAGILGNRAVPACGYWTWVWTKADIAILKNSKCPAVLTENMFQDNREDTEWLLSEEGKRTLTALHADAIAEYCRRYG